MQQTTRVSHPDEPILGLELLCGINSVVDEPKTSRLATSKLRAETEDEDALLVALLVHLAQLLLQLGLANQQTERNHEEW